MADELKPEEFSFSQTQEFNKTDGTNTAISELSKKGYQYLKDNSTKEAIEAFNQILNIEENNNYALVGLATASESNATSRKRLNITQNAFPATQETTTLFLDLRIATRQ